MTREQSATATLAALALACCVACSVAYADEPAAGDSLVRDYVRSMSDSTDAYFGATVTPVDTAGLDSALVHGLAMLRASNGGNVSVARRQGADLAFSPALGFNRVDGGQLGATVSIGRARALGRLSGTAQWTTGQRDVIGDATWRVARARPLGRGRFELAASAGRWTEPFDRDRRETVFTAARTLINGDDWQHYLRRDGIRATLDAIRPEAWASIGWRDQAETALDATTSWTLFGSDPVIPFNAHADEGRARELGLGIGWEVPRTPWRIEARHWTSDPKMGSDFLYRRTRVAAGGDLSVGPHLALAVQGMYGRLRGQALRQEVFFLGGTSSLRSLESNSLQGTGRALGRLDVIWLDDVLAHLHVPHPAMFPLQLTAFGGIGSVWGRDPGTGRATLTQRDWPRTNEWLSEAGIGLMWRPGVPDPDSYLRVDYVVPIGADGRDAGVTVSFQRVLGLVRGR